MVAQSAIPYGRDQGPGSRNVDALSCYLSLIFNHSDTKRDLQIHINFRGRGVPVAPPPGSATV